MRDAVNLENVIDSRLLQQSSSRTFLKAPERGTTASSLSKQLNGGRKHGEEMNIKGKEYTEVKDRIPLLRKNHPDWSITTQLSWNNDDLSAVLFKCEISSPDGSQRFTGYAYEERVTNSSQFNDVNYTAWVENAETSAIGRALANMGYQGSETTPSKEAPRPSAEEMQKVERMQKQDLKAKTIGTKRSLLDKLSADAKAVKAIVGHDQYFQQALANRNVKSMDELPYSKLAELVESFGSFASQVAGIKEQFEEKDPEWKQKLEDISKKMALLL